jgi:AcrR family transcriptional regulator
MATSGARRSAGASAPRSTATRRALLDAAVDALREVGFAGASAREIARRAGSTQSQVFYHYASVVDLLLAALDEVSDRRLAAYQPLLVAAQTPADLLDALKTIIESDLASGDLRVLAEMIAGAAAVPGLGEEVRHRLVPWFDFTETAVTKAVAGSPFAGFVPAEDVAHAVVAGVLGLEMLDSLGERDRTTHLLSEASALVGVLAAVQRGGSS